MGWLFGRKRKPKLELPPELLDEQALRFPSSLTERRSTRAEAVQEAAGVQKIEPLPETSLPEESAEIEPLETKPSRKQSRVQTSLPPSMPRVYQPVPTYIKIDLYKALLGEIDSLRADLHHLQGINSKLHQSEFNEEENFTKLRKDVRSVHDRLLQMDKILFKG